MRQRGSITLFMCMTIMMITSLGFTLIETSRFYGVDSKAELMTATSADNTFSEYIKPLWEQYGILGIDRSHGTGDETDGKLRERILDFASMQTEGNVDYYALSPIEVDIDDYMLLTDNDGEPFIHEAALYYRDNIIGEVSTLVESRSNEVNSYESMNTLSLSDSNSASYDNIPSLTDEQIQQGAKVVDDVGSFKSRGILDQVIPPDKTVSAESFNLEQSVSHRSLKRGNSKNPSKATSLDKIVFSMYLKDKMSNFKKDLGHEGLKYELEYIISGDDNDTDNLKGVVARLLALRGSVNYVALYKDEARSSQALALAAALLGWTGNQGAIEGGKYAIMAAWAYMEGVLDVRLLLDGGKVSMIKMPEEWTSDLFNLGACMSPDFTARNCETGMSYEDYLLAFLVLESSRSESLRALDMMENSMNSIPYYENLKMDNLICDMNMAITYEADPMFFSLVTLDVPFLDFYQFRKKEYRSYL